MVASRAAFILLAATVVQGKERKRSGGETQKDLLKKMNIKLF